MYESPPCFPASGGTPVLLQQHSLNAKNLAFIFHIDPTDTTSMLYRTLHCVLSAHFPS